jgi:hypothetical protein
MCKKLIYLISFVLVLGLVLTSVTKAADPDLAAYWRFDEGSGTVAYDATSNGNDGVFVGDPQWVAGKFGGALEFNGDDYLNCGNGPSLQIQDAITITFWFQVEAFQNTWEAFLSKGDNSYRASRGGGDGDATHLGISGTSVGNFNGNVIITGGDWHHYAGTYDGTNARIYIDGVLDTEVAATGQINISTYELWIGTNSQNTGRLLHGLMDEVRIYTRALTDTEILGVMAGGGAEYPLASGPNPEDGIMLEDTWANLGWRAGDFAVSHDVYLGENFDDVNDGAADTFRGNQAATNLIVGFPGFLYPEGLVPGTTYYWRIDEVNDTEPNSPWKGDIWSFWIPPYTAYNPNPANGVKFVETDVELSWTTGFRGKLHYVYFGDNFDDVNSATIGLPSTINTYNPGTLELEKTYYWRIDEFDGVATLKGEVWSFTTLPDIPITDPSLVGWWKLDEGMGTTAVDWSGHRNHGTINGDPQSVAGYDGGALEFDGSGDYVNCGNGPSLQIQDAITITFWFKVEAFQNTWEAFLSKGDNSYRASRGGGDGDATHLGISGTSVGGGNGWFNGNVIVTDNQWHHWAGTYDGAEGKIYIDGVLDVTSPGTGQINISSYELWIGTNSQNTGRLLHGLMDDVRIYNKALTVEEIQQTMRGDPLLAGLPKPGHGSTQYIRDATPLSWSAGDNASQHDVYFGTDRDAVADADESDTTGIYRGRQGVTIYTPPDVEWGGGPYYWRVDEYNTDATISKGNVWSFTVDDFIGIDDIEDYNDYPPDEIWSTWIDGYETPTTNGALVGHPDPIDPAAGEHYVETTIVHGGSQSMPYFYENNFKYSEATLTLAQRDWTEEGVGVLSLWFYGDAANAAERMYVALNGIAVVYHGNPDAALIEDWTEWRIDLQKFAAQGVNLANVTTISIGFGDKTNIQAGGSGMVLFDDIRLYRPAPEPEPAP